MARCRPGGKFSDEGNNVPEAVESFSGGQGANGGKVVATVPATPGEVLVLTVGGSGAPGASYGISTSVSVGGATVAEVVGAVNGDIYGLGGGGSSYGPPGAAFATNVGTASEDGLILVRWTPGDASCLAPAAAVIEPRFTG